MKKIELQLAMDGAATRTLDQAMEIIDRVAPYLDIIEIGTSFVLRYGMEPVSRVKAAHPDKKILADMKVMDGGYHNCGLGCKAGGDIVTGRVRPWHHSKRNEGRPRLWEADYG